ncbi:hypothetical protein ASG35_27230 [Burkholderia sp. Leaf177]|uniref:DUF7024 domain-containing protein n=1 Tax=Burkholderia sp. Leaf177 TaxID=1736287 RepID=UPI0006F5E995|nr:hypothetical protein [Burkholderia sp. Leaf177]KQR85479.1 hypothetical protein ASG35_27230 [Burkholderia sp. Leaf177]
MSGWPAGLLPQLQFPYVYQHDGLSHSWLIERVIEGWIFDNDRSGFPFGSSFLDYPGSDSGSDVVLKILGSLTGHYYSALNLYFLFGFPLTFFCAYFALRAFGLTAGPAASAALLFDFLPFHFLRIEHLYYTWYFVVPLYFYIALRIFNVRRVARLGRQTAGRLFLAFVAMMAIGSFGIYYAAFGILLIAVSALAATLKTNRFSHWWASTFVIAGVVFGVLLNVLPNVAYTKANGINEEVAIRNSGDSELYGLKLMQLILPRQDHRIPQFAKIRDRYDQSSPLTNENSWATLGVVGSIGLVISAVALLASLSGRRVNRHLALLTVFISILFLLGTIGGLGALFSFVVSSSIRAWNRISVFIGFAALAVFFLSIQLGFSRARPALQRPAPKNAVLTILVLAGLFDQTIAPAREAIERTQNAFNMDRDFVQRMEAMLPPRSAIYQLPYMPFPESPTLVRLESYDLTTGFLQSRALRWSYGGMRGRPGDLFYRALSKESLKTQINVARRLGFAGVTVDRRGFADNGIEAIEGLTALCGAPAITRADGEIVFFAIRNPQVVDFHGANAYEIMRRAGYIADDLGPRYPATLSEGIDFARNGWPAFLRDESGLAFREPWGRWSDANVDSSVKLGFFEDLPQRFTLALTIVPFGPNAGKDLAVSIGEERYYLKMTPAASEVKIAVDLKGRRADSIELSPPLPTSPRELGLSSDLRKLGVGLIRLRIEE